MYNYLFPTIFFQLLCIRSGGPQACVMPRKLYLGAVLIECITRSRVFLLEMTDSDILLLDGAGIWLHVDREAKTMEKSSG